MTTHTLSADQMAHLREIGIDTRDASLIQVEIDQTDVSMSYMGSNTLIYKTDYSKTLVDNGLAFYVYTLQDVLEKLPKTLYQDETYQLKIIPVTSRLWLIAYTYTKEDGDEETLKSYASSLLDAAYKMLCWSRGIK